MPFGHLCVFFGEVSIQIFRPFLHWFACFLAIELEKFVIRGENQLLVR